MALRRASRSNSATGSTCHPELYALVHRGTPGDEHLYLRAAHGARQVLELGCGYGRLLGPLARAGHRVTGLELDPGLLALAHAARDRLAPHERERVSLVHADMRDFQLDTRFERIFIPFSGLYCLDSEAEVIACLRRVRAHLTADGLLVFDAYDIDAFHAEADPQDDEEDGEPVACVTWRGTDYEVYESSRWEREAQRLDVTYRYQPRSSGEPLFGSIRHRYLLTEQVEGLCEQAGLRLLDAHHDLVEHRLAPECDHMVCVAAPG